MGKRKTHEEFVNEIKEKYGNEYEILEKYTNAHKKILVKHKCGYEWNVSPNKLLQGRGCPVCGGTKKKTHEEFVQEIKDKYVGEYSILGKYFNNNTKILVKHNKCGYEWKITPSNLLQGKGCPVCSGKIAKLGINTIWDTDRWMIDLGVSEEDAKKYSKGSEEKITIVCPDCGKEKKMMIYKIYNYKSIGCSCGDGKSYPEKFIFNLLEQLDVDFETEYKPKWIDNKRYDFYVKSNNCIVETHGEQHYKQTSRKGKRVRTLQEEQKNDRYKKETALSNGIKYYIELDCRESNLEWIKNSILNSELNKLFNLSTIDWQQCAEFANKNIVKEVCNYWNNKKEDETTTNLSELFKVNKNTIINYLKRGNKLGWCDYDSKEETVRASSKSGKNNSKKVEIFKNNQSLGIFPSCTELSRQSEELFGVRLLISSISAVCKGERKQYKGFIFKYIIKPL